MDMRVEPPKRNSEKQKFQKSRKNFDGKSRGLRSSDINKVVNNTPNLGEKYE